MATITEHHLKSLAAFDHALDRGPDYKKMAVGGAVVGVVFGFFMGKKSGRSNAMSVAKNAGLGAGAGAVAAFGLFQFGKFVSEHSHDVVATAATKGEFAGWGDPRGQRGFARGHHEEDMMRHHDDRHHGHGRW